MAWTDAAPAVELHADAEDRILRTTSTATVLLSAAETGAGPILRMFGPDEGMLAHSLPTGAWPRLLGDAPCGDADRVVTFLDGARAGLFGGFRFLFTGDIPPLGRTCVPAHHGGVNWALRVPAPGGARRTDARLDVLYKDPSVVRLPDGSWMMVLARYRVAASDPPRDRFPALPGASLGDIVGWRASDPAFTKDLRGPYWLVASQDALPPGEGTAWLGVPGATIVKKGEDFRLDLYYVVEPEDAAGPPYLDRAFGDAPPGEEPPKLPPTEAPPGAPGEPPVPIPGRPPPVRPGVALKRFDWTELAALLDQGYPPEDRWEEGGPLPGESLGRVRVWAASGTRGEIRPIEHTFSGARLRLADPAPLACGDRPDLFVGAIYGGPGAPGGHGVWRAAGLPDGADVCEREGDACTPVATREGLDFVVAAGGAGSWDFLWATTDDAVYGDPDPVRLPSGRAWVAAGNFTYEGTDVALFRRWGAPGDTCRGWEKAW